MNILWLCIVTVFAVWGLAEFIITLVTFICKKTSPKEAGILIIPIKGKCEQAEYILRSAAQQVHFDKKNFVRKIVCILVKPDEQTEKICQTISKEYSYMEVFHLKEMPSVFY